MLKVTEERFAEEIEKYLRLCIEQDRQIEVQCGESGVVLISRDTWKDIEKAMKRYEEFVRQAT